MAGDEAVLRVLLEGTGGVSPESPAGSRPTQPAREQQLRPTRPEPAGRPARRPESLLNTLIDVFGKLRGTIGGFLGPLAGAALDAAKAIRDMKEASVEAARAIRGQPPPGKPDIGRPADELRREELRRRVGAQKHVPPQFRTEEEELQFPSGPIFPPRALGAPVEEYPPAKPIRPLGAAEKPATPPAGRPHFEPLTAEETSRMRALQRARFGSAADPQGKRERELADLERRNAPYAEEVPATPAERRPRPRPYDPTRAQPATKPLMRKRSDQTALPVEDALPMAEGGGLAALAGPAAVVIAVVEAAKLLKAGVMAAVSAAGDLAKGLTAPEVSAASFAEGIGGAAKKASDALIFVAPPLAILAGAAGQAAESLGGLMRNLDSMANRYTGFAPGVAQAQAFATIQHVAGEFRRGREIGDSLSRYVIARTELQEKFEDVKANFIKEVTPAVLMAMSFLERLLPFVELAGDDLAGIITLLTLILQPLTAIKDYFVTQKKPVKITDLSKPFLDALRNMQFAPGQGQ